MVCQQEAWLFGNKVRIEPYLLLRSARVQEAAGSEVIDLEIGETE